MTYRNTQDAERGLENIESLINSALEADNTRDMGNLATRAQAAIVGLEEMLRDGQDAVGYGQAEGVTYRRRSMR